MNPTSREFVSSMIEMQQVGVGLYQMYTFKNILLLSIVSVNNSKQQSLPSEH